MKIIVNSIEEHPIWNWEEKQKSETHIPAGISLETQRALDADASQRDPMGRAGEVSFECDVTFAVGTNFSVKEDGRKFRVIQSLGRKHFANRSL